MLTALLLFIVVGQGKLSRQTDGHEANWLIGYLAGKTMAELNQHMYT